MLRIRTVFTGVAGSPYYSNFYFDNVATSVEANELADLVHDLWDGLKSVLRAGMVAQIDPFAPTISPSTGEITGSFAVSAPPVTFTNVNQALPPATQALVTLSTGVFVGGRQITGRVFVPGYTEGSNGVDGTFSIADAGVLQGRFAALATGTDRIGVWSRKNGEFQQVSSVTVATKWAVLRSRRD
uniref:Uncharacterized protein n=1 Tax=uncultured prokaryote TaxID=198431 RepID=A0A0H5Q698_9ZZZZ|nr:hypothetical protein [uncultured prokaryote]